LLDQFVCVRIVQANGMDLSLFQFDYDQTWAVFFLNADRTIYGRYGSRSNKDAMQDVSIEGFRKALEGALELHKGYPADKESLAGKTGPAPTFAAPERYPSLRGFSATVAPGGPRHNNKCIHCHQVHAAEVNYLRAAKQPILDKELWSYPMPDQLGLKLDSAERATVKTVTAGSPADKAGFRAGDKILRLEGQPIISIADVQWVLHQAKEPGQVRALIERASKEMELNLAVASGWRRQGDFAWRDSTCGWAVARFNSADLSLADRKRLGLPGDALALMVDFVGIEIKNSGINKKDVIVGVDGQRNRLTESEFLAYVARNKALGDELSVTVLRAGKELKLKVPVHDIR
jgi:membrane-associated protease RseP (regulator of RpoE activity)